MNVTGSPDSTFRRHVQDCDAAHATFFAEFLRRETDDARPLHQNAIMPMNVDLRDACQIFDTRECFLLVALSQAPRIKEIRWCIFR